MRRMLTAGFTAALVAAAAACGNGDDGPDQAGQPSADNTPEVCAQAEQAERQMAEELPQELGALDAEELGEEAFEEEAVEVAQDAFAGWSEGLREPADRADDPELSAALTDLADGLAEVARELTIESLQTGEIPGAEDLDEVGRTLTEICAPAPTPTPTG